MLKIVTTKFQYQENWSSTKSHYSKNRHSLFALLNNHLIDYPTPLTLTYTWGLGSLAGIFLGLQIITGLILTMHYAPHASLAFDILEHIMRDVNNGWLWRYLHANGASFFFAIIYAHIGRGLYYFSYVRNPLVWLSGMVIFALMMATAFMGYVLPWGQMSFWGATVITNLFSAIPLIGQEIAFWLWGGFSVDNPTLNRFYTLHFLLPFAIAGVAGLHLILLHRPGSTNPLALFDKSNEKIPFFPYFYWKDLTGLFVFLTFYGLFVFFAPDALGHPDNYIEGNPMVTPTHIVPEWYFLPFYAILRSIPDKLGGVVLMAASIIILFVLAVLSPVLINHNKKGSDLSFFSLRENILFHIMIWFFFSTVCLLAWIGSQPVTEAIVLLGQINTVIYFGWLIYFPILALLSFRDAFEIFIVLSIFKKLILLLASGTYWISNQAPSQFFKNTNFIFFFTVLSQESIISFPTFSILCVLGAIYFTIHQNPELKKKTIELCFFTILSILPLCFLIQIPQNWIHFYLLFETSALSTTILITSRRYNPYSVSAGFMYYFTSVIVSIFLLLGIFLYYLHFGTFTIYNQIPIIDCCYASSKVTRIFFDNLTKHIDFSQMSAILILFSLFIKIGLSPFHGWLIGVNSGAPFHITAYLQTIYKTILVLIFIKYLFLFQQTQLINNEINTIILYAGLATLLICGITALIQSGFKQFWAYLSNATIGFLFILIGINQYMLTTIYLFFYFITSYIFFALLLTFTKNTQIQIPFLYITDFKYLSKINIIFVVFLVIMILTLAGLPPTVLFFVKFASYFNIFVETNWIILIVITILHLVTAFLYLKLIKIMLFDTYANNNINKINLGNFTGSIIDKSVIYGGIVQLFIFSFNWELVYQLSALLFI